MKVKSKLQYWFIILLPVSLFLTAFRFDNDKQVTRLQLARVLNQIVLKALPDTKDMAGEENFVDLSSLQTKSVAASLETGIVCGFPDSSFRPERAVRNHEILWHLKKTLKFLESNAPDHEITRLLRKLAGLNRSKFYKNIGSSFALFSPEEHYENFADSSVLNKIKIRLGLSDNFDRKFKIKFVNTLSKKPVKHGFIAVDGSSYSINSNGEAIISVNRKTSKSKKFAFLVSCPGYKTLRFKRDRLQKDRMTIRLTPATSQIIMSVFSRNNNKAVKNFWIDIDGKKQKKSNDGVVAVKPVDCGYHNIKIEAEGFLSARKLVRVEGEVLKLSVLLDPA
ncbi:MAG: hypothetical protein ACQETH_01450 [Candidatus Rifleibacteriota bacterium]